MTNVIVLVCPTASCRMETLRELQQQRVILKHTHRANDAGQRRSSESDHVILLSKTLGLGSSV
jgi:hypothetical protein